MLSKRASALARHHSHSRLRAGPKIRVLASHLQLTQKPWETTDEKCEVVLSIVLATLLTTQSILADYASDTRALDGTAAGYLARPPLEEVIKLPSWEIASVAGSFSFDQPAIAAKTAAVEKQAKDREETFKRQAKSSDKQIEAKERELERLHAKAQDAESSEKRNAIQCEIGQIKKGMTDAAFEYVQVRLPPTVEISKLNLLAQWPSVHHELKRTISSGTAGRKHRESRQPETI